MNIEALSKKILDLAVSGNLVESGVGEIPASEIVENIRSERQRMITEGTLRLKNVKVNTTIYKDRDGSYYEKIRGKIDCIDNEIPFDAPEGWVWCRLGSVFQTVTGTTPPTGDTALYGGDYPFYKPSDLDSGFETYSAADTVTEEGRQKGHTAPKNSVLVTCIGTVGKAGFVRTEGVFNQQINAILPNSHISPEYTYFSICADYMQKQIKLNASSATLPILNKTKFDNLLFILPPLEQQEKIVEKIKLLLAAAGKIQREKEELDSLIDRTKDKILELAVRGKLVPQNEEDEPACVLLERIMKENHISKSKKEETSDNYHYRKYPKNWTVTTLDFLTDASTLSNGNNIFAEHLAENSDIKLIQPCTVGKMKYLSTEGRYVSREAFEKCAFSEIQPGYLLINRIINKGMNACILPPIEGKAVTSADVCRIAPSENYCIDYLLCVLLSSDFQKQTYEHSNGAMMKRINKSSLVKIPFGFPPLEEQKRIAATVYSVFERLESIKSSYEI